MIIDLLVVLAIAHAVVLVTEDATYRVRGLRSPRLVARHGERPAKGEPRERGPVAHAVGRYLGELAEDAMTEATRRRRERAADRADRWDTRRAEAKAAAEEAVQDVDDVDEPAPAAPRAVVHDGPNEYDLPQGVRHGWRCGTCGAFAEPFTTRVEAEADASQHNCPGPPQGAKPAPAPRTPDADTVPAPTTTEKGTNPMGFDTDVTGPEAIRAAFTLAGEWAADTAEEISAYAAAATGFAERLESLKVAGSTVAQTTDAADSIRTAADALTTACEAFEAALADFDARDGAVGEAVADAGNLAEAEALVEA